MARATTSRGAHGGTTKRAAREIPQPLRVVKGPAGPVPKALHGPGVVTMKVADLVERRWDAARQTKTTREQWRGAHAGHTNADIAIDGKTLLERARQEAQNNPNLAGASIILGAHTVGRNGPTLQILTGDRTYAQKLERVAKDWMEHAGADGRHLVDHLLDGVRGIPGTGEILWQIVSDKQAKTAVAARIHPINSFVVKTPPGRVESTTMRLGVERTETFKPIRYWTELVDEPMGSTGKYAPIKAEEVLHWFRRDEPGQARGVPHIAPALMVASDLRAFEKAVQDAMDAAALFGVILYSTDTKAKTIVLQGETEITPKTMAAIPPGYQAAQIAPQHPQNNHEAWKRSKLQQVLLPLGMPLVVGLMDSNGASYAGGRIDLQNFGVVVGVSQAELERTLLDPLIRLVIREATLARALGKAPDDLTWQWVWPAIPHVDPVKHALAQRMRLQDGTIDDSGAAAEYGLDAATLRASRQREQLETDIRLIERVVAMQKKMGDLGMDPKEWPLLLAASGALTAPGAYLQGAAAAAPSGRDQATADAKDNLAQDQQEPDDKPVQRSGSPRGGRRAA